MIEAVSEKLLQYHGTWNLKVGCTLNCSERLCLKAKLAAMRCLPEVESSRTSLASRTSSRTHFEVLGLGLGLEGQVLGLGLGLEASSPRKLVCPRLEDSTIF